MSVNVYTQELARAQNEVEHLMGRIRQTLQQLDQETQALAQERIQHAAAPVSSRPIDRQFEVVQRQLKEVEGSIDTLRSNLGGSEGREFVKRLDLAVTEDFVKLHRVNFTLANKSLLHTHHYPHEVVGGGSPNLDKWGTSAAISTTENGHYANHPTHWFDAATAGWDPNLTLATVIKVMGPLKP